jgi:hypothetical protein
VVHSSLSYRHSTIADRFVRHGGVLISYNFTHQVGYRQFCKRPRRTDILSHQFQFLLGYVYLFRGVAMRGFQFKLYFYRSFHRWQTSHRKYRVQRFGFIHEKGIDAGVLPGMIEDYMRSAGMRKQVSDLRGELT